MQKRFFCAEVPHNWPVRNGGVVERSNTTVLKTVRPERVSWVRIPPPPPVSLAFSLSLGAFSPEVLLLRPVARKSHPRRCPFLLYARRMAGIWAKILCCTDEQCRFKATRLASISGIPTLLPIASVTETQRERRRDRVTWIGFTTTYNNGGLPKYPQYKTTRIVGWKKPPESLPSRHVSIPEMLHLREGFIPSSSWPCGITVHPKTVTIRIFHVHLSRAQGMFVGDRRMIARALL